MLASLVNIENFNTTILDAYAMGEDNDLEADLDTARSIIPAGTGSYRDFSYIAPEIPFYDPSMCVGCMECVIECPDTAILGKILMMFWNVIRIYFVHDLQRLKNILHYTRKRVRKVVFLVSL